MVFKDFKNLCDIMLELSTDYSVTIVCPSDDIDAVVTNIINNTKHSITIQLLQVDKFDYNAEYSVTLQDGELWVEKAYRNDRMLFFESEITFCKQDKRDEVKRANEDGVIFTYQIDASAPIRIFTAQKDGVF